MPVIGRRICLETTRDEARVRRCGNLAVEFDLLEAALQPAADALGQTGLQDEGIRRGGNITLVAQPQSNDS